MPVKYILGTGDKIDFTAVDLKNATGQALRFLRVNSEATALEFIDHNAASGVHGVGTGSIVGTDLTQTLLNKLLQSPKIKDVDATPIDDVLLDVIDGVLRARNSANTAYATLAAGSLKATSLTTGSVPFIGTGGLLTEDNGYIYWDNSGKNLGLGTNSPSARLHLYSQSDAPVAMRLGRSGGSTWAIYRYGSGGSDRFTIGVIGINEAFNILTDGKVGIGTAAPKFLGHVAGRLGFGVPSSAPTDADLSNSETTAWLDETNAKLKFRIKKSDGTLVTAELAYV